MQNNKKTGYTYAESIVYFEYHKIISKVIDFKILIIKLL
jgi:hypothetical protein